MQRIAGSLLFSPSDLNTFLDNECVTWLDRCYLEQPRKWKKSPANETDQLIRQIGEEHEQRYLAHLRSQTEVAVVERTKDTRKAVRQTWAAMRAGTPIIYQARLELAPFAGWADFLRRVETPSDLGSWSYEVLDTKLALHMKPYFAIQLCCYSEMLEAAVGRRPVNAAIILGSGEEMQFRLADCWHYYGAIKAAFLQQQNDWHPGGCPPLVGMEDYAHWDDHIRQILKSRDDLSRIANIRATQIEKLTAAGLTTCKALAENTLDRVPRMAADTFERLRRQAQLQNASASHPTPLFEVLAAHPDELRHGFGLLPPASPNDVCFDIEGYPLAAGGLEYLLGITYSDQGKLSFRDWWAHDRAEEKVSFEAFVHWVYERWLQDPSLHIYHYASYEVTALKRLMCRYASCEAEIDTLLRAHVFVDLYTVVRQALLVGEPKYSLKNIEHLYLPQREGQVATAGDSIVFYHRWLNGKEDRIWQTSPLLKLIRDYNQADCDSTWHLLTWLRTEQRKAGFAYVEPVLSKEGSEELQGRAALAQSMLAEIPQDTSQESERWRTHRLLAHLLEFHRRENKARIWQRYAWAAMSDEELEDDRNCLAGLQRTAQAGQPYRRSMAYQYSFGEQETAIAIGSTVRSVRDFDQCFEVVELDFKTNLISLKCRPGISPPGELALFPDDYIRETAIVNSIERTVRAYLASGTLPEAMRDLIFRHRPRIAGQKDESPVLPKSMGVLAGMTEAVAHMQSTTLCVQGPPGSGKTRQGGAVIAQLLKAGKRVAVASNSHNAICLLLNSAVTAARKQKLTFTATKCGGDSEAQSLEPEITHLPQNGDLFKEDLPDLVGGTAWLFSNEKACDQFDYLFVDEASQVSVANLIAMAPCAKNIVLLGDQMQLGQPTAGSHPDPGESALSALDYYLKGHATVPPEQGIFLPTSWRMRPELCSFISESIYEGRLQAEPSTSARTLHLTGSMQKHLRQSAGCAFVPVLHRGNTCVSREEAEVVHELVAELCTHTIALDSEPPRKLTKRDILVVAPFNAQVRILKRRLPDMRVGTVDKFQGAQAPIVILSMTASEGNASPRGLEFLFEINRLNVALSRAQILAVIVGSPQLAQTRCSRWEQIPKVNLFCGAIQNVAGATGHTSGRVA